MGPAGELAVFSKPAAPTLAKRQADARLPSGLFLFCGETMGTQQGPSVPHLLEEQTWGRRCPGIKRAGAGDLESQSRMAVEQGRGQGHLRTQVNSLILAPHCNTKIFFTFYSFSFFWGGVLLPSSQINHTWRDLLLLIKVQPYLDLLLASFP